jgi:hypothetical protein
VCVPPSLLQGVSNKKLEKDKKPPLGFDPPQNIISDSLQTYSSNPNPMKPRTNAAAAVANKVDTLPAITVINIDDEDYQHKE